jgi:DNA-binding NarL/FixJ family response regulator
VIPYQIIIADDHDRLRTQVKSMLTGASDFIVVGEARDGTELLDLLDLKRLLPDLIILDISMPKLRGIEAARRIKSSHHEVKILFMTIHREKEYLKEAFASGAEGYLLKEDAFNELIAAIETVRHGKKYLSPFFRKVGRG